MTGKHAADTELPEIIVVAVDGPAGSGKSSVSKATARELGFAFLDTGAAYRAATWSVLDQGTDLADGEAIGAVVSDAVASGAYELGTAPDAFFMRAGETDISDQIREPRVTTAVSAVARVPEVREQLTKLFRGIIERTSEPGIVVEGRDITTVVTPDAQVRILLTASEEARMARRSAEVSSQPAHVTAHQLRSRDQADLRVVDFMNAADGVLTVDSTELDFEQTVQAVIAVVNSQTARNSHGT